MDADTKNDIWGNTGHSRGKEKTAQPAFPSTPCSQNSASAAGALVQSAFFKSLGLVLADGGYIETVDQLMEHTVPIDLGIQAEKN